MKQIGKVENNLYDQIKNILIAARARAYMFPIRHALRDELAWTHYRLIMKVENEINNFMHGQE